MALFAFCSSTEDAAEENVVKDKPKAEIKLNIVEDENILHHTVDVANSDLKFYLKDSEGKGYKNAKDLKEGLKADGKKLKFCMNGGMFDKSLNPVGLYIENGLEIKKINRVKNASGNFHLVPNGVFYINEDKTAHVIQTDDFEGSGKIKFATQSGPMLLIDGEHHPKFKDGSKNLNIRNGVGILPNGQVLFAMSKKRINFYDFASFFKENGCENALYLDGAISQTYLPEKGYDFDGGRFGVLIGEVE